MGRARTHISDTARHPDVAQYGPKDTELFGESSSEFDFDSHNLGSPQWDSSLRTRPLNGRRESRDSRRSQRDSTRVSQSEPRVRFSSSGKHEESRKRSSSRHSSRGSSKHEAAELESESLFDGSPSPTSSSSVAIKGCLKNRGDASQSSSSVAGQSTPMSQSVDSGPSRRSVPGLSLIRQLVEFVDQQMENLGFRGASSKGFKPRRTTPEPSQRRSKM